MEKKTSHSELVHLLHALRANTLPDDEIYQTIQAFGELNFQEARPEVERFLKSDEPRLRHVALKVLTRYWHLEEHWQTAREVLEHDISSECRFRAANNLADLRRNTQDRTTLEVLAKVVCNEEENQVVREVAYAAMKAILHYDPREQFRIASEDIDLEKEVDWDMVHSYL